MSDDVPVLVRRAEAIAAELGFPRNRDTLGPSCCLPTVGRLLGSLAASCVGGRIGEIGTGIGYGTAWMVSAMPADARLVTVELDERRAAAAHELFADDARVTVLQGDAAEIIGTHGPFDLLFVDGGGYGSDADSLAGLFGLLTIGGRIVVDDVTPIAALPSDSPFRDYDAKRDAYARAPDVWYVEVVDPDFVNSALVGTRVARSGDG